MKGKKLLILFCFASKTLFSQSHVATNFWEAGPYFGFANYSGDVAGQRLDLNETRLGFGFLVRRHLNKNFALRVHFMSGHISGSDENSKSDFLKERKLRFFSMVREFGLVGEWNILGSDHQTALGVHSFHATPYLFAGAGLTLNNPTVVCYATPERCAMLPVSIPEPGLEKAFLSFPLGLGGRFDVSERIILGAEVGWRPTFSDYLDGVSENGNPKKKDWYLFFGGTATYLLHDPNRAKRHARR